MAFLWLLSCVSLLGVFSAHGEPASLPELSIKPRIINGRDARPGAWPWHVALLSRDGIPHCGGSLINRSWMITAAHCNFTAYRPALGLHDRRLPYNIQELRIAQVIRHPMFNYTSRHNDIALLKLRPRAHFNSKVSAVRLPRVNEQFLSSSVCKIVGWGFTNINGTRIPYTLQETSVLLVDNDLCSRWYQRFRPDAMLCAWYRGVSPHRGDSGGSLVCWKNGIWTVAGIMSYSRNSKITTRPFVVTRVTTFIPWIAETLAHN